ncbi:MAG: hypothetical protein ACR2PL_13490 [Dehalococcoidia bacterium]
MALVNRAWREGQFVPPGGEPGLTNGRDWRDVIENRAVEQIAQQRFNYPSDAEPDLQTSTNLPERSLGVRSAVGDLLFPDIVVMNVRTTEVRMLAEVETERSLQKEADLVEKWQAFNAVGPFYLFVPTADLDNTRRLLKRAGIKPAGIRAWRHMAGMNYTDIVNVRV